MTFNPTFSAVVSRKASDAMLKVTGAIDERSDFGQALAQLNQAKASGIDRLAIDLGDVRQLNSIGVKKWIAFITVTQQHFALSFERISDTIVGQANVILSILGPPGTPVASFSAPYICQKCGKDSLHDLRLADLEPKEGGFSAPSLRCECGGALAFDEYEDEYFYFLTYARAEPK